jgi:hypothetical protein
MNAPPRLASVVFVAGYTQSWGRAWCWRRTRADQSATARSFAKRFFADWVNKDHQDDIAMLDQLVAQGIADALGFRASRAVLFYRFDTASMKPRTLAASLS